MKIKKILSKYYAAAFPAIIAGVSFAAFLVIYWFLTQRVIHPHYYLGLLFAVPSLYFAAIAYWSKRRIQKESYSMLTSTSAIIFGFAFGLLMLIAFPCVMIHDGVSDVTDVESYERVIKLSCFQHDLIADFPDKLPEDAEDAKLYYSPFAIGQGGQEIAVGFRASTDTIDGYLRRFSQEASWVGTESDAEATQHGVFSGTFSYLDGSASGLSEDFKVYVISGKPYRNGDWNHGENSLVAISQEKNKILFWASNW
ncbi:hypothetical protein OBV_21650 [Oscillibacter valericigenes Sjm18-20]|nr:hypothetical protein OBV_21650 [Oscillibacter valericigenes Sjm18-20]